MEILEVCMSAKLIRTTSDGTYNVITYEVTDDSEGATDTSSTTVSDFIVRVVLI